MTTIIGTDASGKIVAQKRVSDSRKAEQIADYWRGSGLAVEVVDPANPARPSNE